MFLVSASAVTQNVPHIRNFVTLIYFQMDLMMCKKFTTSVFQFIFAVVAFLFTLISYAGMPLWTFTPDPYYPATVQVSSASSATIKYLITNQSRRTHTLAMQAIAGITQMTSAGNCPNPFTLGYQQSCTLSLLVNGGALTSNIIGGPVVCQQGSTLECYQPGSPNGLNIMRIPIPVANYLITPIADANGTITPNTPQTVVAGSSLTFSATPHAGYYVDQWFVDGGIAQKGGSTLTLSNIITNHSVEVSFTPAGTIYAGTASGSIYFSTDNGLTWTSTTVPSIGNAVNSVFATTSTLYVGSADGKIYYSTTNGALWNTTAVVSAGAAVNSVFVATVNSMPTMYAGTQDGRVYYSTDGVTWIATTNPGAGAVNSIFITLANTLYVGSEDGNVYYSIDNGTHWTKINGPITAPIHNVFATSSQLYINTRQTSSNSTLPPGTIDFEYAYVSNSLTAANPTWTLLSQITYTLFVNADASVMHAGTQDGYVFSLTTGDELGFITYSPITSLFFLG